MNHIICSMNSSNEQVTIQCGDAQIDATIDTGSDWTCTSLAKLVTDFHDHPNNLLDPTPAMDSTRNASGGKMIALGYFPATFRIGSKSVHTDLVVFDDIR